MVRSTPRFPDLESKVAVVTGGMGKLGHCYSVSLARQGAKVTILDVADSPGLESGEYRRFVDMGLIDHHRVDITSTADLRGALDKIKEVRGDAPAVLVNNAALDSPPGSRAEANGPFEDFPEALLQEALTVTVTGTVLCCQVFGGEMARRGRGSVINIGSTYGVVSPDQRVYQYHRQDTGQPWYKPISYSASKSSIYNITRYLAAYWGRTGVRVNTLTPGGVAGGQDPRFIAEYERRTPLGRMAQPEDLVGPVLFLASEASSYMTGANMVIDGGYTAW